MILRSLGVPVDLNRLVVLGELLAPEPQLEPDVGRGDDGFHFERADVVLPALHEEHLLFFPLRGHLGIVDARQIAFDKTELSNAG